MIKKEASKLLIMLILCRLLIVRAINSITMYSEANSFSREVSRHFDSYFEEDGITTSYVELLVLIDEQKNLSQKFIADKMKLAPSTITRFVHKLEKLGFVKKTKDGKLVTLSVSKGKQKTVEKLKVKYKKAHTDLVDILEENYVETTKKLLNYGFEQLNK